MATQIIKGECALCVNCCGVDYHVSDGRLVKVEGMKGHPVNNGKLCPKGERLVEYVYSPDRVKTPMKREGSKWTRVSWDEALEGIATKLKKIKEVHGARSVAFFCGSVAVERRECASFTHRFRAAYGSPNFFSVESGCYVSRIVARGMTFGRLLEHDQLGHKCMILWGHNPHASRFMLGDYIDEATERGMKLIVIDPRRIPAAAKGIHVEIRPGTDCALALSMLNVIIEEELYDKEFVRDWTFGFDKLVEHVKDYTPERVEEITWVPAADIRDIARLYATSKPACIIQGVGCLDRQINNMQNSRVLCILQAVTGNIDVPGGWVSTPLYPTTDIKLKELWEDRPIGHDQYPFFYMRDYAGGAAPYGSEAEVIETLHTGKPYPIKALISTAGNPAVILPDSKGFREVLEKLELIVTIDMFMTETARLSHYLLPAACFMETTGIGAWPTVAISGVPYITFRPKVIEPVGESMPDWKIWSELGRKMGYGEHFQWKTDEEVTEYILKPCGIPFEDLKNNLRGIYLARQYGLYKKVGFGTPSGKIEIYSQAFAKAGFDPIPTHKEPSQSPVRTPELAKEYPLVLITGARILEYIHSGLRRMPEIRRQVPYPEVEIHPAAASKYGVEDGEWVIVETKDGNAKFKAKVTKDIHPKVVSVPHGWATGNANLLVDAKARDPIAGYIEDKGLLCRIRKI